jgi:hypothetical protein
LYKSSDWSDQFIVLGTIRLAKPLKVWDNISEEWVLIRSKSKMESLLLALALSACAKDSTTCSHTLSPEGVVVITVCDVAPDKKGPVIDISAMHEGQRYLYSLSPKCETT